MAGPIEQMATLYRDLWTVCDQGYQVTFDRHRGRSRASIWLQKGRSRSLCGRALGDDPRLALCYAVEDALQNDWSIDGI